YVPCVEHAEVIYRYVANLFHRSHQRRKASQIIREETDQAAKQLVSDPKLLRQLAAAFSFKLGAPVSLDSLAESTLGAAESDLEKDKSGFLEGMAEHEETLVSMLRGRPYGFLIAPEGSQFVLSDTCVLTRQILGNQVILGAGFDKPETHVLLPISPKTCLQIGLAHVQRHTLRPDEVHSINADSIRLMHRWVYLSTEASTTENMVNGFGASYQY